MPERYIVASNVMIVEKVVKVGAIWTGTALVTVRGKAAVFESAEEAESARFFVCCKYPLLMERIEVIKLEGDSEWRYHLIGGVDLEK